MPAVRGEKLLTASDLATMCEVDLKTIHNWVDRGRIPHFRTPGRHLRFRAPDVAEFLRTWGYSVPRSLARQSTRGALVLATTATFERVAQVAPDGLQLRHATDPYDALVYAGAEPADAFVVEVEAAGGAAFAARAFEAVHRAAPEARCLAIGAATDAALPHFVERVAADDTAALQRVLDTLGREELRHAPPPEESRTESTAAGTASPIRRVAG
jgi:excisionase family DNA binding protein